MKQILIMRTDLSMRKGKMIAQGAHASLGAVLPYLKSGEGPPANLHEWRRWKRNRRKINCWLAGPFKKVCVRVDSEEALLMVHEKAEEAGLITCLITDSGLTEFSGVPTKTCCAIGPDTDEALDPITGGLVLL